MSELLVFKTEEELSEILCDFCDFDMVDESFKYFIKDNKDGRVRRIVCEVCFMKMGDNEEMFLTERAWDERPPVNLKGKPIDRNGWEESHQ